MCYKFNCIKWRLNIFYKVCESWQYIDIILNVIIKYNKYEKYIVFRVELYKRW